jgi:predicted DNA-binding transcriptional regulator YafY
LELPVTRLLTLLELLQAYRRLSGVELARRLGVAPRTVRRYVATLQEMGIPVGAEAGRYGGYRLRPGFKLPPLMLTDGEALVVVLGLLAARRLGIVPESPAVEGAMAKLDRVLPDLLRDRIHGTQEAVELGLVAGLDAGLGFDAGVLLRLGAAAHDRRQVAMSYRARSGAATRREVDPYGVVFQSGRWYVAAWDHLRGAVRTFRLDRIQEVEVTDRGFERPADFDSIGHVQRSIAAAPWPFTVEVVLDLSLSEARGRVSATVGTLEERPDGVLVRVGCDDLEWAARYLVGLECRFRVLGPPELRQALAGLAAQLAADAAEAAAPG